jgi:hypothetical protein
MMMVSGSTTDLFNTISSLFDFVPPVPDVFRATPTSHEVVIGLQEYR